ncbi:hypothetical protein LTR91_019850 [Friedmanniomyces endolithicus]|uniref:Uncharacterized protein n=1 Tax=Friedmanniomyces endolithicus TaxID=329885 RepID=A0AAN6HD53_9PEZI|nr:hypothetical protein LTR57_007526 [Friedmanniomyces endolithicus]KAK0960406.1 hypothetical protein LTS01_020908 [Friedmanniomyces endolithicus]KAK0961561.1 hypothetical protein LTR91_019850 [Friedmanniomyces endolithicus]KAK1046619.1 hypothetical protein LTS16_005648 [Friedmanniomyces endolithicus]
MPGTSDSANNRNNAPPTSSSRLSKSDRVDLDALNASVDRMRTFTAQQPYILTIPQDEPRYHHAYQYQATQWLHQTPFEWKEGESIQYQTFVYHEHGKDMFQLLNSQPREAREVGATKGKATAGADTPSTGPKKTISLNAYKKKQAGAGTVKESAAPAVRPVDAPVKQAAVKGPAERVKADTEEVLAAVEALEVAPVETAPAVKQDLKRKREKHESEEQTVESAPLAAPLAANPEDHVAKEVRTDSQSSRPEGKEETASTTKPMGTPLATSNTSPAKPQDAGLPPRLSPLRADPLPPRLSPTIPANMEATIKARELLKTSSSDLSAPSSATKNGALTPPRPVEGITKRKSPIPRNAFRANSSSPAVRSDVEEKAISKPAITSAPQPQPKRAKTPPFELSRDDEIAVGKALKAAAQPTKPASKVVKLKYKKQQREAVRRILKMRPTSIDKTTTPVPKPAVEDPPKPDRMSGRRRDPAAKGVAQRIGPAARNKQPEIRRYEPPGRRKDSLAVGAEPAGDAGLGKRKRGVEEQTVKAGEPSLTRPGHEAPAVESTQSQDPAAKRLKVPDPPPVDAVETQTSQKKPAIHHDAGPPTESPQVADTKQTCTSELPPIEKKAAAQDNEEPPAKVNRVPDTQPTKFQAAVDDARTVPSRPLDILEKHKHEADPPLPRPVDLPVANGRSEESLPKCPDVLVAPPEHEEPATKTTTTTCNTEKCLLESQVSSEVPESADKKQAAKPGEPREKTEGADRLVSTKPDDTPATARTQLKESPFKRKKIPEAIETSRTPSTPIRPDLQSPFLQTSTQKSQQVTPTFRKDHLSAVALTRDLSTDGHAHTPSSGASSTPVAINGTTSQPNGSCTKAARTATQQAWEAEQLRLDTLGRELKHAATAHLAKLKLVSSDPNTPAPDQKLAAVKSLESLLAYTLSFTSADEASLAADPPQSLSTRYWRTLHAFFPYVKHNCETFPLLLGLACHLAVVISAHILDVVQQYPSGKQQTLQELVAETHATLFKSAREADARLDCDGLAAQFPRSWERRARGVATARATAGGEAVAPGVFAGEYKLPLGVHTSPLRAARAGYAMLEEWMGREGVEYELKLKL